MSFRAFANNGVVPEIATSTREDQLLGTFTGGAELAGRRYYPTFELVQENSLGIKSGEGADGGGAPAVAGKMRELEATEDVLKNLMSHVKHMAKERGLGDNYSAERYNPTLGGSSRAVPTRKDFENASDSHDYSGGAQLGRNANSRNSFPTKQSAFVPGGSGERFSSEMYSDEGGPQLPRRAPALFDNSDAGAFGTSAKQDSLFSKAFVGTIDNGNFLGGWSREIGEQEPYGGGTSSSGRLYEDGRGDQTGGHGLFSHQLVSNRSDDHPEELLTYLPFKWAGIGDGISARLALVVAGNAPVTSFEEEDGATSSSEEVLYSPTYDHRAGVAMHASPYRGAYASCSSPERSTPGFDRARGDDSFEASDADEGSTASVEEGTPSTTQRTSAWTNNQPHPLRGRRGSEEPSWEEFCDVTPDPGGGGAGGRSFAVSDRDSEASEEVEFSEELVPEVDFSRTHATRSCW